MPKSREKTWAINDEKNDNPQARRDAIYQHNTVNYITENQSFISSHLLNDAI